MSSYNKVICQGNLTRDPEMKYLPAGTPICTFGIAMNHTYKQNDEKKDEVCYLDVVVFGKFAEVCQKYLVKGQSVLADGRLRQRRWHDKDTNTPRSKHELIAEKVNFGPKANGSPAPAGQEQEPPVDEGEIPF